MVKHVLLVVTGLSLVGAGLAHAQSSEVGPALVSNSPGAVVLERILVKVNGGLITQTDLEAAQILALRTRGIQPQSEAELRQEIVDITPEVIVNAVEELLIVQRGRENGLSLSDEQFQDILDGIKEENGIDDDQLVEALARDEGMTLADLRDVMERQMMVGQVQQIEVGRVSITDVEAREYYDTHLEDFTEPATVSLREVLIEVPESGALNAARDKEGRAAAEAVRARVLAGEDFGQVASEVSDAASKTTGGLIGPIELLDLAESVRERIEGLEVGEVSAIDRTTAGYQILKLETSRPATPTPFDDVRDGIADRVYNERRLQSLDEFLSTLRDEAIIEWKDEALKQLYDTHLSTRDITAGGQ
jgi:peptidyl-prolyl cis-trans isomerase SurA